MEESLGLGGRHCSQPGSASDWMASCPLISEPLPPHLESGAHVTHTDARMGPRESGPCSVGPPRGA